MASVMIVLKVLVLLSSAVLIAQARFFLSTDHVDKVLESEEYVITILELYYALDAPEDNGHLDIYTKAVKSQNRDNYGELDEIMSDLFLQVRVLKRLGLDWARRKEKLVKMKHYDKYAERMSKYLVKYPSKADFGAACDALFRYQEVYGESVEDIKQRLDFEDVPAADLYEIGVQALRLGDAHYAAMWLEEAVSHDDQSNPKFLLKLLEIYNSTDLVENCARILMLCQKLEKMKKADQTVEQIYRTNLIKVRARIKEEQEKCPKGDPNFETCKEDIKDQYFEHKPHVPKRAMHRSEAFTQYKSMCSHTSAVVHPSVCRVSQLRPFHPLHEEVFHNDPGLKVIQYHDVYDRNQMIDLLTQANARLDDDKKRQITGVKFRITKPALVQTLLTKIATVSQATQAIIEVQLYLLGDLKFPSDSNVIEGGRTQVICFLNVGTKPDFLVLPNLDMQLKLDGGSCVSLNYGESTEAHKVQHAICPITDGNHWIMTVNV